MLLVCFPECRFLNSPKTARTQPKELSDDTFNFGILFDKNVLSILSRYTYKFRWVQGMIGNGGFKG